MLVPVPSEGLLWDAVPPGQALALEGAACTQGTPWEVAVAHGEAPAAVLQPGDLDLLFGCGWEERPVARGRAMAWGTPSPTAPEWLPSTALGAGLWDTGGLSALPDPPAPGDEAVPEPQAPETPPDAGDPAVDAEEPCVERPPPGATAVPVVLEELLEAPPPFADVPAAPLPPRAANSVLSAVGALGGDPPEAVVALQDADDFPSPPVLPSPEQLSDELPALEDDPTTWAPSAEVAAQDAASTLPGMEAAASSCPPGTAEPPGLATGPWPGLEDARCPPTPGAAPGHGEGMVPVGTLGPPATALLAEGPPAPPDGFIPDNEVFVTQALADGVSGIKIALFCD